MTGKQTWLTIGEEYLYWVEPTVSGRIRAALMLVVAVGMAVEVVRLMPQGFQDGIPETLEAGIVVQLLMFFWSRIAPWGRYRWGPYEPGMVKAGYFFEALALSIAFAALMWGLWAHWSYGWAPAASPLAIGLVAIITLVPFALVAYLGHILWRRRRPTPS